MTLLIGNLDLTTIDNNVIVEGIENAGVARKAGVRVDIPMVGSVVTSVLSDLSGSLVKEGDQKKASGKISEVKLTSNVLQTTVVTSTQNLAIRNWLPNTLFNLLPQASAHTLDRYFLGVTALPGVFDNFKTVADTTNEYEISEGVQGKRDFNAAKALIKNGQINTIWVSTGFKNYLEGQYNDNGAPIWNITDTHIETARYFEFSSAEIVAYAGDGSKYLWGLTDYVNGNGTAFKVFEEGIITDFNGVEHNLTDNKIAIRHEVSVASGIVDEDYFVKLVGSVGS